MGDVGLAPARLLTMLALGALGAGCGHPACAPGTVLVSLSLEGAAAAADALEVTLAVDGAAQTRTVARPAASASQARERLALTFGGSAYPSGRALALTVTALAAGVPLAEAEDRFTAEPSCTARSLTLGAPPGADGSPSGDGASDGDGGEPGCPGCQLTALGPAIAPAGATLTLEGTFGAAASVRFPGAAALTPATVLGPHRAQVVVPDDAGEGALTVVSGGVTLGPLRFRRVTFSLGLGRFDFEYAQADGPRPRPFLHGQHATHPSWVVGDSLYVAGGETQPTLERATFHADGTLSAFSSVPGVALTTEREGAVALCLGRYCYAIGGTESGTAVASVERATIGADGRLSTFAVVPQIALTTARRHAAHAVVGNYLYVIAGADASGGLPAVVERATIAPDGSLSTFEEVPGCTIDTGRSEARAVVSGGWVHLLGGRRDGVGLTLVERAAISPDGGLSAFTRDPGTALVTGRGAPGVAVLGSSLYLVGGLHDDASALVSVEKATIALDGSLGAFVTANVTLTVPRWGLTLLQAGNLLTAVGGRDVSATSYQLGIEQANIDVSGALDAFSASAPQLHTPRYRHTATVLGQGLQVLGGVDATGANDAVERALLDDGGALGAFQAGTPLTAARSAHGAVASGSWLYLYGGSGTTIDRAPINGDGTLGAFAHVSGASLAVPRYGFATVALGSWLYVLGGMGTTAGLQTSIERAPILADGTLGAFALVSGLELGAARFRPVVLVSGNYLYVIAGSNDGGALTSVERASVNTDGTVSGFTTLSDVQLAYPREAASAAAFAGWLYVIGGRGSSASDETIEAAPIAPDGTLGAFTAAGVLGAGHSDASAVVLGNTLYLLGGRAGDDYPPSEQATLR